MEIGILKGHFEEARRAVDSYPFDVIIGSFHCTRNDDMYRYDFAHADGPAELEDFYTYMYECLKEFQDFDIAGHFSILDRYIGTLYDYGAVEDQIDEILKLLINNGKGLEINTSSFKYGTGTWLPRRSILSRYLNLGGEILTFGSDAHNPFYYQYHLMMRWNSPVPSDSGTTANSIRESRNSTSFHSISQIKNTFGLLREGR